MIKIERDTEEQVENKHNTRHKYYERRGEEVNNIDEGEVGGMKGGREGGREKL